jgi:hypothetical protein
VSRVVNSAAVCGEALEDVGFEVGHHEG